jgi:ATP-dependent Clp protease ATP-binding subunit ClpC
VDFRNTIIIMTSNVGTEHIRRASRIGFNNSKSDIDTDDTRHKVEDALKQFFRPEFLNRLDGVIIFQPLSNIEIRLIATIMLKRIQTQLAERAIVLEVQEDALDLLAERGYDPALGARPLRRIITNLIEDPLSEGYLEGRFQDNDTVVVDTKEALLRVRTQRQIDQEPQDENEVVEVAELV